MGENKKVFVKSFGCPMRKLDGLKIQRFCMENNLIITEDSATADISIFITCGINESKVKMSLDSILLNNHGKKGIKIITGCLPSMRPELFAIDNETILLPINKLDEISSLLNKTNKKINNLVDSSYYDYNNVPFGKNELYKLKHLFYYFEFNKRFLTRLTRRVNEFVKVWICNSNASEIKVIRISNGCNNNCSYCGIRYAVGKLKSKTVDVIKEEYLKLISDEYMKILFIADDTGSYGVDMGKDFPFLLKELYYCDTNNKTKWLIQDISPYWALKYRNELLFYIRHNKFEEILFSVQHASNRILRLMKRKYEIDDVSKMIKEFSHTNRRTRLLCNFIIGFPSETDEDFQQIILFLKKNKFEFVYIFKYYELDLCSSSKIYPKVPVHIIEKRINEIEDFLKKQKTFFYTLQ